MLHAAYSMYIIEICIVQICIMHAGAVVLEETKKAVRKNMANKTNKAVKALKAVLAELPKKAVR